MPPVVYILYLVAKYQMSSGPHGPIFFTPYCYMQISFKVMSAMFATLNAHVSLESFAIAFNVIYVKIVLR